MPDGNIYIPDWTNILANEVDRFSFFVNRRNPALGYRVTMRKTGSVWAIYDIHEGTLRPGWYAPWEWDSNTGVSGPSATGSNTRYWTFNAGADLATWNVPATGAGCDKGIAYVIGVSGGGSLELVRNPASDNEVLGTISTNNATTVNRLAVPFTLSAPLAEGDVLGVRWPSGETAIARLCGIVFWDDDGTWTTGRQMVLTGSLTSVYLTTTTTEFAYGIAPDGLPSKWIGGYQHSGGGTGNSTEVNPTETWMIDGEAHTFSQGYASGDEVTLNVTSTVSYDVSNPAIASLDYTYHFEGDGLRVENTCTLNQTCDASALYVAMFAIQGDRYAPQRFQPVGDNEETDFDTVITRSTAYGSSSDASTIATFELLDSLHPVERHFIWDRAAGAKLYWRANIGNDLPAGTVIGGDWRLHFTVPSRPVRQAATIGPSIGAGVQL